MAFLCVQGAMAKAKNKNPVPFPPSTSDRDYQAEDDHRTLSRAAEIRTDAGRMKGVRAHHEKQRRALGSLGRTFGGRGRR